MSQKDQSCLLQASYQKIERNHKLFPIEFHSILHASSPIWLWGDTECLNLRPRIAIVGTRRATRYALEVTSRIVRDLSCIKPVIISGLAMGIDAAAHQAALQNNLKTIGILGCCINQIYPQTNRHLFKQMREQGLLISEYAPGTQVQKYFFAHRNRLITALADIVIVVEAPFKSGALITAKIAAAIGKEVYVVPGSIMHQQNWGAYQLVNDGAKIYYEPSQIFHDLKSFLKNILPKKCIVKSLVEQDPLFDVLRQEPVHIDKLLAMRLKPPDQLLVWLMEKTIAGQIKELPGKYFIVTS